jgi:CRISPR/Cas system CSM-associated protein Csm3 (group 7 of RAMP superfamily)
MTQKCEICRFSCKSDEDKVCKFIPQEHNLGFPTHFKDPNNEKHEDTSRMCVVCKVYYNFRNIKWIKEKEVFYPFCTECAKTQAFIRQTTPRVAK